MYLNLIIPFLVRFGGIAGEFGRGMARILARCSLAKIQTMAKFSVQVSDLISWDIMTVDLAFDWLTANLGTGIKLNLPNYIDTFN